MKENKSNINPSHSKKTNSAGTEDDNEFPDYPSYPAGEDIYNTNKEEDLDPDDLSSPKRVEKQKSTRKIFPDEEVVGEDLDVPGDELDDEQEDIGSEDEENNYYSLASDNQNDNDED